MLQCMYTYTTDTTTILHRVLLTHRSAVSTSCWNHRRHENNPKWTAKQSALLHGKNLKEGWGEGNIVMFKQLFTRYLNIFKEEDCDITRNVMFCRQAQNSLNERFGKWIHIIENPMFDHEILQISCTCHFVTCNLTIKTERVIVLIYLFHLLSWGMFVYEGT